MTISEVFIGEGLSTNIILFNHLFSQCCIDLLFNSRQILRLTAVEEILFNVIFFLLLLSSYFSISYSALLKAEVWLHILL